MASVSQDLNLSFFRTASRFVWPNTRQVSLLPRVTQFWWLWRRANTAGAAQWALQRGNGSVLSELWRICDVDWWEAALFCTSVSATVSELFVLAKKQELIPRCWILSLEMGRSGLNDYSNGWVGEQEAGRCEMSGLDTHCLCFNPFKAASFMLPQAAVPFSSSLPFDFGEFGINFTYNSWLLCTWPQ